MKARSTGTEVHDDQIADWTYRRPLYIRFGCELRSRAGASRRPADGFHRSWRHVLTRIRARDLPSRTNWIFLPRSQTHHVQCITHTGDGCMHLAIEAGAMIRSRDNGRTFKDRLPDSPVDTHVLLTHPLAPQRLYAAFGDALLRPGRSFAESPDGGDTGVYSGKVWK